MLEFETNLVCDWLIAKSQVCLAMTFSPDGRDDLNLTGQLKENFGAQPHASSVSFYP
jgi:hypothetical protein